MKKMMLLASVVALAALMLAAAPAFAQDHPGGGSCESGSCENPVPGCENEGAPQHNPHCNPGNDGDGDNDNDNDNDNDRDVLRNLDFGNVEVAPVFDISQDIEQDCDSGDVSQPVDVSQTGDNSIQTVGVQPTANTGCAQNATGILQAAPIVAVNNDDNNGFFDDGRFIRCDRDGDGNDDGDDCDDFDNDRVFCDRDRDGHDDGDDDCFVFVNDDNDNGDVFRNIGNDNVDITGPDFGDVDVDSDASIDLSPSLDVDGGGTINQTATAESNTFLVKPWWMK
jgi:hypothetical protein